AAIRLLVWALFAGAAFGRPAPLEWTLEATEAVALIRVTSVTEELREELLYRHAILTVIGAAHGLAAGAAISVEFGVPSRPPVLAAASDSPFFFIGNRSIVLLKREREQWIVLRQIYLSKEDDTIAEPRVFRALGFDRGSPARFAVDRLIAAVVNKPAKKAPSEH
ncbi:MAG: hypothetical protein ABIZ49_11130, partial [Opitutaceae bacterium]